jgi:hypothetical protein
MAEPIRVNASNAPPASATPSTPSSFTFVGLVLCEALESDPNLIANTGLQSTAENGAR